MNSWNKITVHCYFCKCQLHSQAINLLAWSDLKMLWTNTAIFLMSILLWRIGHLYIENVILCTRNILQADCFTVTLSQHWVWFLTLFIFRKFFLYTVEGNTFWSWKCKAVHCFRSSSINLCFVPEIPNMILFLGMCDRAQHKISRKFWSDWAPWSQNSSLFLGQECT